MKTVQFLIEKVDDGYTAYAKDYSILTEADTLKEVYEEAEEAFEIQLEETKENREDFQLEFKYDFATLFEVYRVVNVAALGERIGINRSLISQYINGTKTPSLKQKQKIEEGLHDFAKELLKFSFA